MPDPLAIWWVHAVTVKRWLRTGQGGVEVFADPETVTGFYDDRTNFTAGLNGEQITAAGTLAVPSSVAFIPLQSQITLPAAFGGRTVRVVATAVGDSGGLGLPDHAEYSVV